MVTIINFKERQREDGTEFYVLELQGGIEMIKSKLTGNFYATAKKAFIPSTFDMATCTSLIGTQMQGKIVREACETFNYIVKETGEEISLNHRWVYKAVGDIATEKATIASDQNVIASSEVFSKNGILEPAL